MPAHNHHQPVHMWLNFLLLLLVICYCCWYCCFSTA